MSGTERLETLGEFAVEGEEFVYPKGFFLQRIKEEIYRCNRRSQCFLWFEIPLKGIVYDGLRLQSPSNQIAEKNAKILEIWKIAVQTMLSKEYMGAIGQNRDCLWCLYTNKDLHFLEEIKSNIEENIKRAGLSEYVPATLNFAAYFYSGKSQSFVQEENRLIKNWNKESSFLMVKRVSIENVKEKTVHGIYSRFLKRFIDILGSSLGIILFSLVMLICAVFVKRALSKWEAEQKKSGKEPPQNSSVLFKQIRVGRNGKLFKCYKLRTMYPGADKEKEELKKQQETEDSSINRGPTFKMDDDPRILKYGGAFLRKHSLDELPQFFNVFKGDMSLVGPRPPTPDEIKKYEAWHYIRLAVKPGLTCIWQTSGRSDIDFDEWMRLDNRYIRERSTLGDLNLKLKTIEVMFNGKGAS
ncbi:MAG: sugar transferase [Candidatus Fibromonas sp.]|jgi:lipopolysaccharide/colanic/teichoic acid biosynthesis glycosyltransferase|nr:sugar transferase [Candidatus Fibromonas sp.]